MRRKSTKAAKGKKGKGGGRKAAPAKGLPVGSQNMPADGDMPAGFGGALPPGFTMPDLSKLKFPPNSGS